MQSHKGLITYDLSLLKLRVITNDKTRERKFICRVYHYNGVKRKKVIKSNLSKINAIKENKIKKATIMKSIAMTVFQKRIASKLESAEYLLLVSIENEKIKSRELVPLKEENPLRKIDVIFKVKPDILICGRLTKMCEYKLEHSNIKIIPGVQGNVEYILSLCLNNAFIQGYYDGGKHESSYSSNSL